MIHKPQSIVLFNLMQSFLLLSSGQGGNKETMIYSSVKPCRLWCLEEFIFAETGFRKNFSLIEI